MRIIVTTDPDAVTLDEPDDFTSFAVVAPEGTPATAIDRILGPVGRGDGEHVWVDRDGLADLAGERAGNADWQAGLAAMIDYARSNGFLSDDGAAIRAHIDWAPG